MSHDLEYVEFIERLSTLRYQHAVVNCGQKLLHLVLKTLICGNINNISDCLRQVLGSNTQYRDSFTRDEQRQLGAGDHESWDICLLYKVIQKVCGLHPVGDHGWTQDACGQESLEYLITMVKELRNDLVHQFQLVITDDQLSKRLIELADLADKITSAVAERAQQLDRQLYEEEVAETIDMVNKIIADVKRNINESVNEGEDESDEEDDAEAYNPYKKKSNCKGGTAAEEKLAPAPSLREVVEDLIRKFWKYAGHENANT